MTKIDSMLEHRAARLRHKIRGLEATLTTLRQDLHNTIASQSALRGNHTAKIFGKNLRKLPIRQRLSEPTGETSLEVLLLRAMIEHFPTGATVNQLAAFIDEQWQRAARLQSYSVYLTGLKHKGEVYKQNRLWYPLITGNA